MYQLIHWWNERGKATEQKKKKKLLLQCKCCYESSMLILPVPCITQSCTEIKIKLNFYFRTSSWCLRKLRL